MRRQAFRPEERQRKGESGRAWWARLRRLEEAREREHLATYRPELREEAPPDELADGFRRALERNA